MKKTFAFSLFGFLILAAANMVYGQTVVDFTDGTAVDFDDLDPDDNPDPTVDLSTFNDNASVTGHNNDIAFNLRETTGRTSGGAFTNNTETNLNNTQGLGIKDANSSSNSAFRTGEEMVFDFSVDGIGTATISIESLTFRGLSGLDRQFTLTSSAFDGKGYEDAFNSSEIFFNENTDTFSFTNTGGGSGAVTFFLTKGGVAATSSDDLLVSINELDDLTLGFTAGTVSREGRLAGFKIHAVPEPGTIGLLSACAFGFALYRRRRKTSDENTEEAA